MSDAEKLEAIMSAYEDMTSWQETVNATEGEAGAGGVGDKEQ